MLGTVSRLRKFKSLSPLTSPHASPPTSPKIYKKKYGKSSCAKTPNQDPQLPWKTPNNKSLDDVPSEQMIRSRSSDEMELRRIQNLFPFDNLQLFSRDPCSGKNKTSLARHGRTTTTSKLQRVLSGKSKVSANERHSKYRNKGSFETIGNEQKVFRRFIMDGPVTITVGMQSQQRLFILFTDILLIAKVRSSTVYKLKEQVRVSEIWLGDCVEDVCEVTLSHETSFVIGWPTTNVVATFRTQQLQNMWYSKLKQLTLESKFKEPRITSINVILGSCSAQEQQRKQIKVTSDDSARDCIKKILHLFGLNALNFSDYQLWVKTVFDPAPYPLIGHELPFAIKMHCTLSCLKDGQNPNSQASIGRCDFILRNVKKSTLPPAGFTNVPRKGKSSRRLLIMSKVFRRCNSKPESLEMSAPAPTGHLFGRPLSSLCQNNELPKPIMDILVQLVHKGPYTHGIFRKSATLKACRELREKLDTLQECNLQNYNILLLTSVLKDFLRSLPDCILLCELYDDWLEVLHLLPNSKITRINKLFKRLPPSNLLLLEHLMCVLWYVAQRSFENQMTPINLAVCIGPSLLWSTQVNLNPESSKKIPALVEFLIKKCSVIFGKRVLYLFGLPVSKDVSRQDSGAEESDSIHSSGGLGRDDSSLDSLGEGEPSPKLPNKAKVSLSNLSRDSGLTMSDTQLYAPDEEDQSREAFVINSVRGLPMNGYATTTTSYRTCVKENVQSRRSAYNQTLSSCEMVHSAETRRLIRSKSSHFPFVDSEESTYPRSALGGDSMGYQKETVVPPTRQGQMELRTKSPKKEVHKKRLARPRQWYNPATAWELDDTSPASTLKKSNSEENLAQKPKVHSHSQQIVSEPNQKYSPLLNSYNTYTTNNDSQPSRMFRSASVHHLLSPDVATSSGHCNVRESALWHRTQSTPHLDDGSYDSSTVSDDDSTPHVSRSNSRGKDYSPSTGKLATQETFHRGEGGGGRYTSADEIDSGNGETYSFVTLQTPGFNCLQSYEQSLTGRDSRHSGSTSSSDYALYANIDFGQLFNSERDRKEAFQKDEVYFASPVRVESSEDSDPPPPLPPKPPKVLTGAKMRPKNVPTSSRCCSTKTVPPDKTICSQRPPIFQRNDVVRDKVPLCSTRLSTQLGNRNEPFRSHVTRVQMNRPQFRCKDEAVSSQKKYPPTPRVTKLHVSSFPAASGDGIGISPAGYGHRFNREAGVGERLSNPPPVVDCSRPPLAQQRVTSTAKIILNVKCGNVPHPTRQMTTKTSYSEESYV